ncbi:hypothetical protein D9M71_508260 [compost metagenome]
MFSLIFSPAAFASASPFSTVARSPPRAMRRKPSASRVSREMFSRRMPHSSSSGSLREINWPLLVRLMSARPRRLTLCRKGSSLGLTSGSPPVIRSRSIPAASIR